MTNAVLAKLRAFVTGTPVVECELCAQSITAEHQHLLQQDARRVFCACEACVSTFAHDPPRPGPRYLRVERRAARLHAVEIDDLSWAELGIAGGLAFFTTRSRTGEVVATFPGRAGIIETFVPLRAWSELERRFPALKGILPDVEALLVRRSVRHHDYFQVSIDHCYELSSLLRTSEVPLTAPDLSAVQSFFSQLEQRTSQKRHSRRPAG